MSLPPTEPREQRPQAPVRGTILLDPEAGSAGVIDSGWRPAALRTTTPRMSSAAWLVAGVGLLLLTWLVLSLAGALADAFARAPALGVVAALAALAGAGMLGLVAWRELAAWRALGRVDRLRRLLADDRADLALARHAAMQWVQSVAGRVPEVAQVSPAIAGVASMSELRTVLEHRVATPLAAAAAQIGGRAALEAGAVVALCPHPALDGLVAGLRGLAVMREVASLYGLRPSIGASLALTRRVAATAIGTAGIDLVSQGLSDQLLQRLPVVSHVAAAIPGATVTAVRLYRLARICALACSPLSPRDKANG